MEFSFRGLPDPGLKARLPRAGTILADLQRGAYRRGRAAIPPRRAPSVPGVPMDGRRCQQNDGMAVT